MTGALLTLNAGSSSLKFALYDLDDDGPRLSAKGQVEGIGRTPHMTARSAKGAVLLEHRWPDSAEMPHEAFFEPLFTWADAHLGSRPLMAVGHRIVHGGSSFHTATVLDDDVLAQLDALSPLAPLHQPHNLAAVRAAKAARPDVMQVGCFDTAFHHGHDDIVTRFALPGSWHDQGIRRYGFHGLSYEFVAGRLAELDPTLAAGRVLIAHLGNGASLCALRDGRSVDTTMGLTALDGLMMGTRCGALDPGVVLYLEQQVGLSAQAVQTLLYEQSGLLGVSALSGDMRVLLASDDPKARLAVELFTFRIAREAGALVSSMGGIDGLVFTAGIGEHAAAVRADVAARLFWLGVEVDPAANAGGAGLISTLASKLKVWVIPTDEEAMIAHHTADVAAQASPP